MLTVDYKDYMTFLRGADPIIPSDAFGYYARLGALEIRFATCDREIPEEQTETVKLCCCHLAHAIYLSDQHSNEAGGKTSERVGSYSVTYGGAEEQQARISGEKRRILRLWLADTGLLYAGVG